MLTSDQIRQHLAGLTYLPGWELSLHEGRWEGRQVIVHAEVPNSYHPEQTVDLDIHCPLPPMETHDELDRWLQWRLARIAIHESREWLRRDGKPLFDPHDPYADRDA